MNAQTRKLFQIIFQEAHVIDVDLSEWDRRLRLVVSAGLVGENFQGRGPLHNVDFVDVSELSWRANHRGVALESPDRHFQWVIMEFDVSKKKGGEVIKLSGVGPAPELEIGCTAVQISSLDPAVVDRLNPEWNRPYRPLARPGFEELLKTRRRR